VCVWWSGGIKVAWVIVYTSTRASTFMSIQGPFQPPLYTFHPPQHNNHSCMHPKQHPSRLVCYVAPGIRLKII
jgi:hypothetical protein